MKSLCMLAAFTVWQPKTKIERHKGMCSYGCIVAYHGITFKYKVINYKDSTDWLI